MISTKKELDEFILADAYRYFGNTKRTTVLKAFLEIPGFRYSYFLRKCCYHKKNTLLGLIYRLILRRYQFKYGYQITPNTKIDKGFFIGHFGPIVINSKAKIGKNCNIAVGVIIGQANRGKTKGYPTIGDYVWIGVNSIIVGNINIGTNVLIAPGAYVNVDVPDNSIALGNPCKIIYNENATDNYIENPFSELN